MTSTPIRTTTRILPRSVLIMLLTAAVIPACSDSTADSATESESDKQAPGSNQVAGAAGFRGDTDDVSAPDDSASSLDVVPLFDPEGTLLRPVLEDTGEALITRLGDRARDRHAREDVFASYDHYLNHYWEHRTVSIEIVDTVGRAADGGEITFHVTTQYKLSDNEAELRFFYRGVGTVAEYHNNGVMTPTDDLHYVRTVSTHGATNAPLQPGDEMEFELSQFLDDSVEQFGGRANYYGTTFLYVVGQGIVPWEADVVFGSDACPCDGEISRPIAESGWLGGRSTLPYQYSSEPRDHFMQMAGNLAGENAQPFVLGRRLVHTEFHAGTHSENGFDGGDFVDNPAYEEQVGKLGPLYVHESCDACHVQNSRALPPAAGTFLDQYVFLLGDEAGLPLPTAGRVLQPGDRLGAAEGSVALLSWEEEGGLRRPVYGFEGVEPATFSARIAPQLVGMGLLEAIPEEDILALADPDDADDDGVSGRPRILRDPESDVPRLGRFGWKAARHSVEAQVAAALNTDMGVMTRVFPQPDCGSSQEDCGSAGQELADDDLEHLVRYVSLLGVRARRNLADPTALEGEELFSNIGCASCHTPQYETSPHAFLAEVRGQRIHPYTDLLLHDMGPGLADSLDEEGASGAEWRTPPLWNIGLTADVSAGEAYLHDGRARTLEEAILWHGGEGATARDAYQALSEADRAAVIAFLRSL